MAVAQNVTIFINVFVFELSRKFCHVVCEQRVWAQCFFMIATRIFKHNKRFFEPLFSYILLSHTSTTHYKFGAKRFFVNNCLIKLQKTAVRLITFSNLIAHSAPLFNQLKLNTLNELVFIENVKLTYQALNNLLPCALSNLLRFQYVVNNFYTRA